MANAGITISHELRPCLVGAKQRRALFHQWYPDSYAGLVGVVEYEDGSVVKVTTKNIRFLDSASKFDGICWDNETEDDKTKERKVKYES